MTACPTPATTTGRIDVRWATSTTIRPPGQGSVDELAHQGPALRHDQPQCREVGEPDGVEIGQVVIGRGDEDQRLVLQGTRWKSWTPSSRSSVAIDWDSEGCATSSRSAARPNPPSSTMARK